MLDQKYGLGKKTFCSTLAPSMQLFLLSWLHDGNDDGNDDDVRETHKLDP